MACTRKRDKVLGTLRNQLSSVNNTNVHESQVTCTRFRTWQRKQDEVTNWSYNALENIVLLVGKCKDRTEGTIADICHGSKNQNYLCCHNMMAQGMTQNGKNELSKLLMASLSV
jgi:hypothetical protein